MKKTILVSILILNSSFLFAGNHWNTYLNFGYKFIPGKYHYIERIEPHTNGDYVGIGKSELEQKEMDTNLHLFTTRVSFIKKIKRIEYGFESGMDITAEKTGSSWNIPKYEDYTGIIRYYSRYSSLEISNQVVTETIKTVAIPLVLRFNMIVLRNKMLDLKLGLSFGEYIIKQFESSYRYLDSDSYSNSLVRDAFLTINSVLEFAPEIIYKFSDSFQIGLKGEIGYVPPYTLFLLQQKPYKFKYEFGGITYGGGISLNLGF